MRVIIVGAGEVGRSIAEGLVDAHDVAVVDCDEDIVEDLTYSLDALAVRGDGTDLETLEEAGLEAADLLIASTDVDEVNVTVCGTAKAVHDPFTIARVKRRELQQTWQRTERAYGADFMVSSDLLTAEAIYRVTGLPGAHDANTFINGLVRMAEFEIDDASPVVGHTVAEADRYESLTFAAVFRGEALIAPRGDTVFEAGDRVVVIGSPESVTTFAAEIARPAVRRSGQVVIAGGGDIGFETARVFEEHGHSPIVIEADADRARTIAEALPGTTVFEYDASERDFLEREHVDEAETLVAAMGSDEKNMLVAMLADRIGVERTIAVIESVQYAELFEAVGVDVAISTREETAEEIVRFTRDVRAEKVAMLEHDRAEVLEIVIDPESELVGSSIEAAIETLPEGVVFGAISRDGTLITPRGKTTFEASDHVVVFVERESLEEITDRL